MLNPSHLGMLHLPPLIDTIHDESFGSNNSSDECNTSGETIDIDVCMQTPITMVNDAATFHGMTSMSASIHPTSSKPLVSAFASQQIPSRAPSAHMPAVNSSIAASMISTLPTLPLQQQQAHHQSMHHHSHPRPQSPPRPTRDPAHAPRFTHTMSSKKQKFDAHFATDSSSSFSSTNFSSFHPSSAFTSDSAMQLQQPSKQARQVSQTSVSNLNQYRGLDEDSDTEEEVSLSQRSNATIPLIPSLPLPQSHHNIPTANAPANTSVSIMPTDVDLSSQPVAGLNDYIRLNVGGQLFQTTFQTLFSQPNSYFTSRFGSGRFQEPPSSFDSSYFIDRDGTHFRHILNYMRDLVCAVTDYDSLQEILREARFYQLDNLAKIVQDKISEINIERMNLDNNTASSNSATNKSEQQTTTVVSMQLPSPSPGFMQGLMAHTRAPGANQPHMQNRLVLHPQTHYQRNLFVSRWGTGGMAGAGPTTVTTPITTTVVPTSASSSSSHAHDDSVMMMTSHMSPAHPQSAPGLRPVRTSSCPSQLNGFHATSATSGSATPIAAASNSSSSNGNADVHHSFTIPQLQQVHQPQQQLIATMPPSNVFSQAHLSTLDPASQAQLLQFQSLHQQQHQDATLHDKPFVFSIEEDF